MLPGVVYFKLKKIVVPDCVKIHFGKCFKIPDRSLNLYLKGYVPGYYGLKLLKL